jgi:hypothetical protein
MVSLAKSRRVQARKKQQNPSHIAMTPYNSSALLRSKAIDFCFGCCAGTKLLGVYSLHARIVDFVAHPARRGKITPRE